MIETHRNEDIATVRMARGGANALNAEFLDAIRHEFEELRQDLPRGVVLTSRGGIYSAGLDLLEMADADEAGVSKVLEALSSTLMEIFTFPRPVVAAINGHAVAGGALLTLACDARLMVMGEGKWGLTESQLALAVPGSMIELARYGLTRPVLERLLYGGQAYPAFKAREMGILDDLVEDAELETKAAERIRAWPPAPEAFGDIKARLKAPTVDAIRAARERDTDFVERWFRPEVRARLEQAVSKLRERS